jgi:hypothetical protein
VLIWLRPWWERGTPSDGDDVNLALVLTAQAGAPDATVEITARLHTVGTIAFTGQVSIRAATVEALVSSRADGWEDGSGLVLSTNGDIIRSTPGGGDGLPVLPFELEAVDTFDVVVGTPFQFAYRMDMDGGQSGGSGDGRSTIIQAVSELSFELPPGHITGSDLGYTDSPVPVPGPNVAWLMLWQMLLWGLVVALPRPWRYP